MKTITEYIVVVAYRRYKFLTADDAVKFAETAACSAVEPTEVVIRFATEEIEVDGKDAVS